MIRGRLAAVALATALLSIVADASAQGFPSGMPGAQPPPSKPKKDPNVPETHAASGSGDDTIPKPTGGEPQLPTEPTEIPEAVRKKIGSSADRDVETGRTNQRTFSIYPPYVSEESGDYRFRTLFPVWIERIQKDDRASQYGLLYHQRRSEHVDADILFPFYWNYRHDEDRTVVVGPVARHVGHDSTDTVVAPFVFTGTRKDGGYTNIPLLLTFLKTDERGGRTVVGPGFCFWKGGKVCNPETADSIDFGVAPLFFGGKNERGRYELVPPLLHYYRYTELDQSWLNVWGPVITSHTEKTDSFHVAPLFFHTWGKNEDHITIPPLIFHYGYTATSNLLVTPLFLNARGDNGEKTFVTWGYARYRGRTTLDMITPFYWHWTDPTIGADRKLLFPFYYGARGPRDDDFMLFPFYGHFQRKGIRDTHFYTPFLQHTTSITGWELNLHPLIYLERDREHSHTVVAPFFFDFATPSSRATVAFPIYWRFADDQSLTQVALNTYYHEKKLRNGLDWEFHFFPFFSYGETPNGHFWNVLYGLAGYTRSGAATKMRLFWVPIPLSKDVQ